MERNFDEERRQKTQVAVMAKGQFLELQERLFSTYAREPLAPVIELKFIVIIKNFIQIRHKLHGEKGVNLNSE